MSTCVLPAIGGGSSVLPPISSILESMSPRDGSCRPCPATNAQTWRFVDCHKPVVTESSSSSSSPPASPQFAGSDPARSLTPPSGLTLSEADLNKSVQPVMPKDESSKLPGKRWKEKRDLKYGLVGSGAVFARLRVSMQGLTKALPAASKAKLTVAIQQYVNAQMTPEQFAETIQMLVDEFHVVVPSGREASNKENIGLATPHQKLQPSESRKRPVESKAESRKRPAEPVTEAVPEPKVKARALKKIKVEAPEPVVAVKDTEIQSSAWEALLSVCSRM
eukprot:CAMPEP_0181319564 /NCGR_PEP_ID=MMETSP1101-20121128/17642_1 /TAXON_ID=46948 /ORGANISM="Rhodomonas abbreviata, Strain Caron Lab Isolate" /LENGTH=277 /DNA_ID=CAMNT_0023427179 /DNA_START=147 /DNA_END=980 /DNA_ORIENTATION=-